MGVEPKIGGFYPQKWMVYNGNPIKMDDLGGFPPIFANTHMFPKWCFFHGDESHGRIKSKTSP